MVLGLCVCVCVWGIVVGINMIAHDVYYYHSLKFVKALRGHSHIWKPKQNSMSSNFKHILVYINELTPSLHEDSNVHT
jgi:hypothetical protein